MKTYDVHFNDNTNSSSKGFKMTIDEAKDYIKKYNGTHHSYFGDYQGGTVSVVCNQNGEVFYEELIKNATNETHIDFMNELNSFFDRYQYSVCLPKCTSYASTQKNKS